MGFPGDPALFVVRAIAWVAVAVYAAVLVFIVGFIMSDEGAGEARIAIVISLVMALPLTAYAWGLAAWWGRGAWVARLCGWAGMLLGPVPLISFSFLLVPLVLAASPTLLRWREKAAVTSPGRTVL